MATERYVVLGLAHVRSSWFREVARWSTSATIPVDFVKNVSVEEVRARLRSGRAFSALVVDAAIAGLDRDLVDLAREVGCAVLAVDDGRTIRDWPELGVSAVVPRSLTRADLLEALSQHASAIARTDDVASLVDENVVTGWRGRVVAVTGAGGVGSSTVAMAAAQGLGSDVRFADMVVLCDLALDADLGMLHDAGDVVPGVLELVDAHRGGRPSVDEIRSLTFQAVDRHYDLLLGLRRHRDWTAVRPRAFDAALDGLRRAYRVVIADIDPDLEGEAECGSLDVEERNLLARSSARRADLVVVVGLPGMKGLHALLRVIRAVLALGVEPARVLPVVNRAPRGPRARAEIAAAIATLLPDVALPSAVHLPERRRLDDDQRDGVRLPSALVDPVGRAVKGLLDVLPPVGHVADLTGARVSPGSLGSWSDEQAQA